MGLGGGRRQGRGEGSITQICVLTRVTTALGGFRHEGQMKAGALHCRVEDRSQPWAVETLLLAEHREAQT